MGIILQGLDPNTKVLSQGYSADPNANTDPEFNDGLNAIVAIEIDTNASGVQTDEDGDKIENWQPMLGLGLLPCRVVIKRPKDPTMGDRRGGTLSWRVLFGQSVVLDQRHRLKLIDPDNGAGRYGYIIGRCRNAHQMSHHWVADAIEYVM
jgi:hypothetical protein